MTRCRIGVLVGVVFLLITTIATANPLIENQIFRIPETNSEYANHLEKLARDPGFIGEFFKLKLAEKHLRNKNPKGVEQSLRGVHSTIFNKWKSLIQAETHLATGKAEDALRALPKLPTFPKPELSFGESFYKNLVARTLWARYHAKTTLGQKADRELSWLSVLLFGDSAFQGFLKDKPAQQLSLEQKLSLLHNLHFAFQFKKIPGVVTVGEITSANMPRELRCRGLYELGDGLRAAGGHAEMALTAFQALLKSGCDSEFTAKGLYRQGTLALALNRTDLAQKSLMDLNQKFPKHRLADDALYLLTKHFEKRGMTAQSKKYAELLLKSSGDMREEYLFEQAYPLFKRGLFQKAAKIWSRVHEVAPSPGEAYPRNLYWHGHALEKSGGSKNLGKARTIYRDLTQNHPYSFYSVLAASRAKIKMARPTLPTITGTPPATDIEFFDAVAALNSRNLHSAASAMLDLVLHIHPEWDKSHKEYIARMMMESQNYRKALDMAANHFDSGVYGPTQVTSDPMFSALYPQAYRSQISKGYASTNLPHGAIEGIMREESLFQHNARSWVGATGLMQLMPATAKMVQRKLSQHAILEDLTDPQSNIMLGSTYLQDMVNYFDQQLPLAIMAYNAGPGNVNKWLRARGHIELDEFIEDIPFTETRGYVKRVLRSMQVYGGIYGETFFTKPSLDFTIRVAKK